MKRFVVGKPVRSASSRAEELALLFAMGSEGEARTRVQRAEARKRLALAQSNHSRQLATVAAAESAVAQSQAAFAAAEGAQVLNNIEAANAALASNRKRWTLIAAATGVSLAGAGYLVVGGVGLVVGLVGFFITRSVAKNLEKNRWVPEIARAKAEYEGSVAEREQAITSARTTLQSAEAKLAFDRQALTVTQADLSQATTAAEFDIPVGVTAVVHGYVPFRVQSLAGYMVMFDSSGAVAPTELSVPDLVHDLQAMQSIRERVTRFEQAPVLLRPTGAKRNEVEALYGEEEELRATMDDWVRSMREIPVFRETLPLVARDSGLMTALLGSKIALDETPGTTWIRPEISKRIRSIMTNLEACFEKARAVGGDGEAALRETYERLRTVLVDYGERRKEALRIFQSNVHGVLSRSSLLSTHCYCPRCNRIPEYLYLKLGVPLEEAHLTLQEELLERLKLDPEIADRLATSPTLRNDLLAAWRAIGSLQEDAVALRSRTDHLPPDVAEQRFRAFENQQKAVLEAYRATLRHVVLGSPRAAVELGRSSRLHLDPETFAWTCAACQSTWTDLDVIQMGSVLRVKDDLLIPMWNHLWTEKDDFRKSELFRTNEQLTTFSEKEGEKLLSIAESYRGDLRGVRERIVSATAESETNRERLFSTLDGLVDMQLMTAERSGDVRTRLERESGASVSSLKRKAEANEMLLLSEPQSQLKRRNTALDPIHNFSDPSKLFKHVPPLLAAVPQAALLPEPPAPDGATAPAEALQALGPGKE